mgnify:CR=1 FL=1
MTPRNLAMWSLAVVMLGWMTIVAWQSRRCQTTGGQFTIVGWRCVTPKPSIILRREIERT